jgi:RNA polymerase sporulation-specific sigma factor
MTNIGRTDEDLVRDYRSGRVQAVDCLMERYKSFVRALARARFLIGGDQEDLIQEGMIGLYKAVQNFDETKNASFRTFAALCINRQIAKAIEEAQRKKHIPLNDRVPLTDEEWNERFQSEGISPEAIVIGRESTDETLKKIKQLLSPMETQVLDLYLSGLDYREIAAHLGREPKSVDNAIQRIRKKSADVVCPRD